jgi:Fic family protein
VHELHERLMQDVRGGHATPGQFRRSQNWNGGAGSTPATAAYVPPPPAEMDTALNAWESFLHRRGEMPDLIQCALIHEHFEAIHPFLDGNGRIGRLLITLFLMERGRLSQPLLYLSAYIEERRRQYYDLLQGIRTDCAWQPWLHFFLAGVAEMASDATRRAQSLMNLRETYRSRFQDKPRAVALLDELFTNPYITAARAQQLLCVSNPTARAAITALRKAGVLEEISGRKWNQVFLARPILEAIERRA